MVKIGITISSPTASLSLIDELDFFAICKEQCDELIVLVPSNTVSLVLNGIISPINQDGYIKILKALKPELVTSSIRMDNIDPVQYIEQLNASVYFYREETIRSNIEQIKIETIARGLTTRNKSYIILNGTYKINPVPTQEIFPLKRYPFHGRQLWGPKRYSTMEHYYQKSMNRGRKDIIKYAYRKYSRKGFTFPVKNKQPAKINLIDNPNGCSKETARCKYLSKKGYMTPVCCSTHIVEILFYVTDILEKHGITYFIYWGTLLGSLRHGGLIPWDSDADLYILESDSDKVIALESEFNKKYFMSTVDKNFMRVNYSEKNRTHLDIYIANIIFQ